MADPDFTDKIVRWFYDTYKVTPDTALAMMAGLQIGVALVIAEYPEYARRAHYKLSADYRRRIAGSDVEFQAMAIASGDERTSPEKIADELVEAFPLPT